MKYHKNHSTILVMDFPPAAAAAAATIFPANADIIEEQAEGLALLTISNSIYGRNYLNCGIKKL